MRTDGNTAGIAALARIASTASPSDSSTSSPLPTSVATTCNGIGGVLEPLERDVFADEPAQRAVGAQRRREPEDGGAQPDRLEREHVAAAQPRPDRGETVQRGFADAVPGDVGGVEGADGGADQQVGFDASGGERLEHADLDRSQAPTARQHEGGRHRRAHASRRAGKAAARRARVSAASSSPKSRRAMS